MIQTNEFFHTVRIPGINLPWTTLTLIGLVLVLALALLPKRKGKRGGAVWDVPNRKTTFKTVPNITAPLTPFAQMEAISQVEFEVWPLLNKEEYRLLPLLEAAVRDFGSGHRVMAQTSLGEIIRPKDSSASATVRYSAYASINSKRLDFAIFDRFGRLVAAIEYQGSGHYQTKAFLRDAVKREAVRKAGVPYIEIEHSFHPDEVRARLRPILRPIP